MRTKSTPKEDRQLLTALETVLEKARSDEMRDRLQAANVMHNDLVRSWLVQFGLRYEELTTITFGRSKIMKTLMEELRASLVVSEDVAA